MSELTPNPTQVDRPWQTTTRTVVQAVIALATILPGLVAAGVLPIEAVPWLAGVVAAAAVVTRVMADPNVEAFLTRFVPWLAADPDTGPGVTARPEDGWTADEARRIREDEIEEAAASAPPPDETETPPVNGY